MGENKHPCIFHFSTHSPAFASPRTTCSKLNFTNKRSTKTVYLNCHTYFSLRYGTLSPEQLVLAAKKRGVRALALTDINNTSCAGEFVQHCCREGIKPLLGIDFRREDGQRLFIGIARNNDGFAQLNRLLSDCSLEGTPLPEVPPPLPDTFFIYPKLTKPIGLLRENEFLGIRPEHVHLLYSSEVRRHPEKLVVFSPVTFADEEGWELHRLLRAIGRNTLITKLEAKDTAKHTALFHYPDFLEQAYALYPKIIENTLRLIEACDFSFETGLEVNRQTFTGSKEGDFKLLEKLALNGCRRRYGEGYRQALERVQKELKVIRQMDFCSYFLITWDIVRYAASAGYHHVGRGSGANSITAYCLGITDVEPLELNLYFERFINPHRSSPPDFDIDFSWDERDDVTDYIFKRYGREYTALLATYNTFQFNAAVRELGKVFGLPKQEIDHFADEVLREAGAEDLGYRKHERTKFALELLAEKASTPAASDFSKNEKREAPLQPSRQAIRQTILRFARLLHGFPNHLSIHAGGLVISEKPIFHHTALQAMPKGFPIAHFDMYHAEDMGFHKFDILSQRGLGHIKDAVLLVKQNQGIAIDIHDLDHIKQDEKVRAQLRSGQCIGCFYIESPAMRGLLHKLRCDTYVHLVAASSIIRPGVAKSGMMKEYIRRFHSPHSFEYLHPIFKQQLGETFGVMVYQEDVMKIVHHFAGLALAESDILRRQMTGKKRDGELFRQLREKYFENCRKRGYSDALANEVWRQIESFSGYSFCKAHSASFAAESFQSLYLKACFPLEFMVAVINNFGGYYRTEYYIHEARMAGGHIHAPCVNRSFYLTHIEGEDIFMGFVHLERMERTTATKIIAERTRNGSFRSLADFTSRVDIDDSQLELLIRIGAFRFTGLGKCRLMWEKNAVFNPRKRLETSELLFAGEYEVFELPELAEGPFDQAFDEIELLGFPLCSPFDLLADETAAAEGVCTADLKNCSGQMITIMGYYVCRKDLRTVKGELMHFGTWLDRNGRFFDTTHFPGFIKNNPFRGRGIYCIEGRVAEEYGFPSIEVVKMKRLPWRKDERYGVSGRRGEGFQG